MIVIEGPDCAGKSHLAEQLKFRFFAELTHYSKHDRMGMLAHAATAASGNKAIVDRFHLSDIPYSAYCRGYVGDHTGIQMINRVLLARASVIIICLPSWETVKRAWLKRVDEEMIKNQEILRRIYKWYDNKEAIRKAAGGIPVVYYNYKRHKFQNLAERIDALTVRPVHDVADGESAGKFYVWDSVLLVGEKVSSDSQHEVPFTGHGNSGEWLTDLLRQRGISESRLSWINIKAIDDEDNTRNILNHVDNYRPRHIIALGDKAANALDVLGISYTKFQHPQYHKRFKSSELYPLIPHLERIIS